MQTLQTLSRRFKLKTLVLSLLLSGCLLLTLGIRGGWSQDPDSLGWTSFGIDGEIAYAPVRLDGYELFSIAAPLVEGDSDRANVAALQIRRNRIENRLKSQLQSLLNQGIAPDAVQVITTPLNQQVTVQPVVAGKPSRPLLTITALDAEIYGLTPTELGTMFAQRVQAGLVRGIVERRPDALWPQVRRALMVGAIAVFVLALLYQLERRLRRSRHHLRQQLVAQPTTLAELATPAESIALLQPQMLRLQRQLDRRTWQKRLLQITMLGIGLVACAWMLQCFPKTHALGVLLVAQPLGMLGVGLATTLGIFLSCLAIDWVLAHGVHADPTLTADQRDRQHRRAITIAAVWKNILITLWSAIGIVLVVSLLTLSSGWTLTVRLGVLGVLVSLAFQSAIKDALAGSVLLAKDAYVVGDLVTIQDLFGVVETMGLYITQIRSSPGSLVTLRNSAITSVANHSYSWARMDFTVWVDHDTDVNQALAIMRSVFESLSASPDWAAKLIDEPDILGVEQLDSQGILLRIRAQTHPGQQWSVIREYRLRLNQAFRAGGIKLAIPQRELRQRTTVGH